MNDRMFQQVEEPELDIRELIRQESVVTHFQPIVSIKKKGIIGVEALARGDMPPNGTHHPAQGAFRGG